MNYGLSHFGNDVMQLSYRPATIGANLSFNFLKVIRRSPFALRNRMTERTSHLMGLWIGAAISNTAHR
jgi:hypothetical protein